MHQEIFFALIIKEPHIDLKEAIAQRQVFCSSCRSAPHRVLLAYPRIKSAGAFAYLPDGEFSPKACAKSPDTCLARCLDVSAVGRTVPALKLTLLVPASNRILLSQLKLQQIISSSRRLSRGLQLTSLQPSSQPSGS